MVEQLAEGVVHEVPLDMKKALSSKQMKELWNGLTPLGRNEWICWTISVKQEETRKKHIKQMKEMLLNGKRRPCCWPGCKHR